MVVGSPNNSFLQGLAQAASRDTRRRHGVPGHFNAVTRASKFSIECIMPRDCALAFRWAPNSARARMVLKGGWSLLWGMVRIDNPQ
jgi:hypothetical protein